MLGAALIGWQFSGPACAQRIDRPAALQQSQSFSQQDPGSDPQGPGANPQNFDQRYSSGHAGASSPEHGPGKQNSGDDADESRPFQTWRPRIADADTSGEHFFGEPVLQPTGLQPFAGGQPPLPPGATPPNVSRFGMPHQFQNQPFGNQQSQSVQNQNSNDRDLHAYALNLVNKDRTKYGAPPVQESAALDRVAQAYAEYLAKSGFFGHVDPFGRNPEDRAKLFGVKEPVSENLAWADSNVDAPPVLLKRCEDSMMAEPKNKLNHRYNILNARSHYVGLGVARIGEKVVLVQEFSEREP